MAHWVTIILALSLAVVTVNCQTFQYSRGWTNGKRAIDVSQNLLGDLKSASQLEGTGSQLANLQANCRLQKMKMLLQGTEQAHLPSCEFLNALRRFSVAPIPSYIRHRSSSENSSSNY